MAFPEEKGFFGRMASSVSRAFVPPPDPQEAVKQWTKQIRVETRNIDKNIREVEREKMKAERQIKQYAKSQDLGSAKIIAREVVNSKKAVGRLHTQKAHMMEMEMALKHQLAMVKVAGAISKSGEIMKSMNALMKVGAMQAGMQEMSKEMMKAGLIEGMMDDAMEDVGGAEEEDVDEEVQKVLLEVAGEDAVSLPAAGKARVSAQEVAQMTEEQKQQELEMLQQLAAGQNPQYGSERLAAERLCHVQEAG